jgi:hypothetical protein
MSITEISTYMTTLLPVIQLNTPTSGRWITTLSRIGLVMLFAFSLEACLVRDRPLVTKQMAAFPIQVGKYSVYTFDKTGRRKWARNVEIGRMPENYVTFAKSKTTRSGEKVEDVKFVHLYKHMYLAEAKVRRKGKTRYVIQAAHVTEGRVVFYRGLSSALTQYLRDVFGTGKKFVATDFSTGDSRLDVAVIKKAVWRYNRILRRHEIWIRNKRFS